MVHPAFDDAIQKTVHLQEFQSWMEFLSWEGVLLQDITEYRCQVSGIGTGIPAKQHSEAWRMTWKSSHAESMAFHKYASKF